MKRTTFVLVLGLALTVFGCGTSSTEDGDGGTGGGAGGDGGAGGGAGGAGGGTGGDGGAGGAGGAGGLGGAGGMAGAGGAGCISAFAGTCVENSFTCGTPGVCDANTGTCPIIGCDSDSCCDYMQARFPNATPAQFPELPVNPAP